MRENDKKTSLNTTDVRNEIVISIFLMAILFLLSPYSPLYHSIFNTDQVCYRIMGTGLVAGKIPYRDLFDHKGPVAFFLYGLGYLISGNANWGAWMICVIIMATGFIFTYRTLRLFFDADVSLVATLLIPSVNALLIQSVLKSGSTPDDLMLAPLMISTYILLKESVAPEVKEFKSISGKGIFLIGLMAGVVFMTKLNICMLYFFFIGSYLLWLLIRKKFMVFLKSTGLFLSGIALVTLPCVLFLYMNHALSDFWNVYFMFNLFYSKSDGGIFYLINPSVTYPARVSITIILIVAAAAIVMLSRKGVLSMQKKVLIAISFLTFVIMCLPAHISYFYIVFVPLYTTAFGVVCEKLLKKTASKATAMQLSIILIVCMVASLSAQVYFSGFMLNENAQKKEVLTAFEKQHPNLSYISFFNTCAIGYVEYLPAVPECRLFYLPPVSPEDLDKEQIEIVKKRLPDTIVYINQFDEAGDSTMRGFIESQGYVLYATFDDYGTEYFYVRDDIL